MISEKVNRTYVEFIDHVPDLSNVKLIVGDEGILWSINVEVIGVRVSQNWAATVILQFNNSWDEGRVEAEIVVKDRHNLLVGERKLVSFSTKTEVFVLKKDIIMVQITYVNSLRWEEGLKTGNKKLLGFFVVLVNEFLELFWHLL